MWCVSAPYYNNCCGESSNSDSRFAGGRVLVPVNFFDWTRYDTPVFMQMIYYSRPTNNSPAVFFFFGLFFPTIQNPTHYFIYNRFPDGRVYLYTRIFYIIYFLGLFGVSINISKRSIDQDLSIWPWRINCHSLFYDAVWGAPVE